MGDRLLALSDRDGRRIELGRELGRGGEGVVHDLPEQPGFVAKLYHAAPDAAKQAKLRLMAESIDSPLRNYAAWPEETLHDASGAVIGFTMQRIEQRLPIHMLYSPAQRRESFPKARFDFLVFVARNIAAAFETLHAHGHVLGDVNQGNVLIGDDSRVILIDCDSFQIQVGDELHRCEVGVAHFTPPELQSISSFEDITRTPNHDAFGLALLIFHLLMGGRHPYSGVPLADKVGESLEADIRDYRYAYAGDAAQRLIAPPPKSVPIASLPPDIVALFERTFSETGAHARPSAQEWVVALDALREQLKQCAKQGRHVHAGHLDECPWCVLDRKRVMLFSAEPGSDPAEIADSLDLAAMQAAVASLNIPDLEEPRLSVLPGPADFEQARGEASGGPLTTLGLAAVGIASSPLALPLQIGLGSLAMLACGLWWASNAAHTTEPEDYAHAWNNYQRARGSLQKSIDAFAKSQGLAEVREWRAAVTELEEFRNAHGRAMDKFREQHGDDSLREHMRRHLIKHIDDARITPMQRMLLAGVGIETAEDFDRQRVDHLRILDGDAHAAMVAWKARLVHDYRRSHSAAPAKALAEFMQNRQQRLRYLEDKVREKFARLQLRRHEGHRGSAEVLDEIEALRKYVQAGHDRCSRLLRKMR